MDVIQCLHNTDMLLQETICSDVKEHFRYSTSALVEATVHRETVGYSISRINRFSIPDGYRHQLNRIPSQLGILSLQMVKYASSSSQERFSVCVCVCVCVCVDACVCVCVFTHTLFLVMYKKWSSCDMKNRLISIHGS